MTLASALRALQTSFPQFLCVAKKPHYLHDTSWRYVCVFPHIFRSCIPFAGAPFLAGSKRHLGGLIVCCMPVLGVSSLNSGRACHGPFFLPDPLYWAAAPIRPPGAAATGFPGLPGRLPRAGLSSAPGWRRSLAASRVLPRPC